MHILRFDTKIAWVQGIASWWRDRLHLHPSLRICLPSGNTPTPIYAAMAQSVARGEASFRGTDLFALDEYGGLAPSDPGLCVNMLRKDLIDHIDIPANRFHWIDTQAPDVDRVCRDYDAAIGAGFDLTILGIGLNGHLGLNEPGSVPESETRRVEMHPASISASAQYLTHSNTPKWGVAVGMRRLLESREVWLLASGATKAEIIQRTAEGEIGVSVPASLLRYHPNCSLIVDGEAGSRL